MPTEYFRTSGKPKPGTVSFAMWVGAGLNEMWEQALTSQNWDTKASWVRAMMASNLGINLKIGTASNGRTG